MQRNVITGRGAIRPLGVGHDGFATGEGAGLLVIKALDHALARGAQPIAEIGPVNAHATSTPVGDLGELAAIRTLFAGTDGPAISATKSATGHLLGAAGGLEAIFTALALRDQVAPPTRNLTNPDPAAEGLDLVGPTPRTIATDYAISNGFGFGGVNASPLLRHWTESINQLQETSHVTA